MSLTRGQEVITYPLKELMLGDYSSGCCAGFTGAFIDYTTRDKKEEFVSHVQSIQKITPDLLMKLKKSNKNFNEKALSTDDQISLKTLDFLKMIKHFQDKHRTRIDMASTSLTTDHKEEKTISFVYADEFIYTVDECNLYLRELQNILQKEKDSIAIEISLMPDNMGPRVGHDIGLSYDSKTDIWLLADINALSVPLYHDNKNGSEIKATILQSIKSSNLFNTLKDRYFMQSDYISASINIFTRSNTKLNNLKLRFSHLCDFQDNKFPVLVERTAKDDETIMHLAARNNDLIKIKKLKEFNDLLIKRNIHKENILFTASSYTSIDVMKFLLEQNIFFINEKNIDEITPAFLAAQENNVTVLQLLARYGANLNLERKHDGFAPIHIATQQGSLEALKEMLKPEYGVNINNQACDGETAVSIAAYHNHADILELLNKFNANLTIPRKNIDLEPIHVAAQQNSVEALEFFLKTVDHDRPTKRQYLTPLHIAAANNSLNAIFTLTKHGADINNTAAYLFTPLHYAVTQGGVDTVKVLIKSKADILVEASNYSTPLSIALSENYWDKAILLLLNIPFNKLSSLENKLIVNNGKELLNQLDRLCATIIGKIDKIELLKDNILMLLHKNNKLHLTKVTPMLKLIGIFKQSPTTINLPLNIYGTKLDSNGMVPTTKQPSV